jgi:hypothetical protein
MFYNIGPCLQLSRSFAFKFWKKKFENKCGGQGQVFELYLQEEPLQLSGEPIDNKWKQTYKILGLLPSPGDNLLLYFIEYNVHTSIVSAWILQWFSAKNIIFIFQEWCHKN